MSRQPDNPQAVTTVPPPTFPLGLAIANLIITGVALGIAAANWQWSTHTSDALPYAWSYVNVALIWSILALWPAIALSRAMPRSTLCDAATVLITAIPAMTIAAFLANRSFTAALPTIAMQLALTLFAFGAISWRTRIPPGLIAGFLAALAVIAPIFAYLWLEFLPTAPQAWLPLIPALHIANPPWWPAIVYALAGAILTLTAPRAAKSN